MIDKFNNLVKTSKKFNIKKDKTFFEVTKYPYREQVSSNILAFYLDINEEHNLKDTVAKALIISANENIRNKKGKVLIDDEIEINDLNIETEYYTKENNRIDIVIFNEDFAIGVENKLEANLYNNLPDYANTINEKNKINYKIVLSIKKEQPQYGFINILYKDFLSKIKELIKDENIKKNKWYLFLEEFIETIYRKEEKDFMNKEFSKWYTENEKDIESLMKQLLRNKKYACEKVNELGIKLDIAIKSYGYHTGVYNHDKNKINEDLCSSICNIERIKVAENVKVTIDNIYSPKGWELKLNTGNSNNREIIMRILKEQNINSSICSDKKHLKLCDFEDNDSEYSEIINMNIKLLETFKKAYNQN